MNDKISSKPNVVASRKISMVWFIPFLALVLGAWLVYKNKQDQGSQITIDFKTAEGLETGKTKIKYKNVDLGVVENISLKEDMSGIIVGANMDKGSDRYLNENTQFWVVRPRIDTGGISGLGTLLSGAHIEMDASTEGATSSAFVGLEHQPLVPSSTPGVKIKLRAKSSGSLVVGSPVYYKDFKVGKIETVQLNSDFSEVDIDGFIESPYDKLVNSGSKFWNVSGASAKVGADGISLQIQSLESLIIGGVSFDSPVVKESQMLDQAQMVFDLYPNELAAEQTSVAQTQPYILNFSQSIRGLNVGAPVEYKGIEIGQVLSINLQYDEQADTVSIPVLIEIETDKVGIHSDQQRETEAQKAHNLQVLIDSGFRAKLQTGNLLTGQLFVSVDFLKNTKPAKARLFDGYPELPTVSTDLGELAQNAGELLDKVNKLNIEELIDSLKLTIDEARGLISHTDDRLTSVLKNLDQTLSDSQILIKGLDEDSITRYQLNTLLKEIEEAARSVRRLSNTIEENPNSVIFGKSSQEVK